MLHLAKLISLGILVAACIPCYGQGVPDGTARPGYIEGMNSPRRVPQRYIVIFRSGAIASMSDPRLALRENGPVAGPRALREASEAVAAETARKAQTITRRLAGRVVQTFGVASPGFIADMSDEAARSLISDPDIEMIIADEELPNVTLTSQSPAQSWGLDRIDQPARPLDNAYHYVLTGAQINAYVMDSGIRVAHVDFENRASLDADFVGDTPPANGDCIGHGTQVASILGGKTYGVAKAVRIHSVRNVGCNNATTKSAVIASLDWLYNNAYAPGVLNISQRWLANKWDPQHNLFILQTASTLTLLNRTGFLIVVGAGNDGPSTDAWNFWPSGSRDVIVVAATTQTDTVWSGSTLGTIDLFAPGDHVKTAWYSSNTATTSAESGTSLAAPHVAGVIALLLERTPTTYLGTLRDVTFYSEISTSGTISGNLHGAPNLLLYSAFPGNIDGAGGGGNNPGGLTPGQNAAVTAIIPHLLTAPVP